MRKVRRSIVALSVLGSALAIVPAAPAAAAPPAGDCPPSFDGPLVIEELPDEYPPVIRDFARFLDGTDGGNADGLICIMPLATDNQSGFLEILNVLDNRVAAD